MRCRNGSAEGGIALLELLLCAPVLIALLGGAVVLGAAMNDSQNLLFVTRNLAATASRQCRASANKTLLQDCMKRTADDYLRQVKNIFPEVKLVLSAYCMQNGMAAEPERYAVPGRPAADFPSQFTAGRFSQGGDGYELIRRDNTIFVAEAYVPARLNSVPFVSGRLLMGIKENHYASSVY